MRAASCETLVLSQTEAAEGIMKMEVLWQDPDHAPHAGQFFMLRGWADDEAPFLSRPISLHSWDAEHETLTFLYQVKGQGTDKLAGLEKGDIIRVTGPMGNGFDTAAIAAVCGFILILFCIPIPHFEKIECKDSQSTDHN